MVSLAEYGTRNEEKRMLHMATLNRTTLNKFISAEPAEIAYISYIYDLSFS